MSTYTLRPNSDQGQEGTWLWTKYPSSGGFYDKVDESSHDSDSTRIITPDPALRWIKFGLPNPSLSGVISNVRVYMRVRSTDSYYKADFRTYLYTGGTGYSGTSKKPSTSYALYYTDYAQNPKTSSAWTWSDINNLQIGVEGISGFDFWSTYYKGYCTQIYAVVTYTVINPPTVTTNACSNQQSTSLQANGEITATGGQNCHTRGFCYIEGTSGDPTTADSKVYDDGGGSYGTGSYSKVISGLNPGTSYRVRAYAINTDGGTGYGTTVTCETAEEVSRRSGSFFKVM